MTGHGGWLGRRDRSGDWMVEQAVHVWDVLHWIKGETPGPRHRLGPPRTLRGDRPASGCHRPLLGRARMGGRLPRLVRPELDRAGRRGIHRLVAPHPGRAGGLRFLDRHPDVPRPGLAPPDDPARPSARFPDGPRSVPGRRSDPRTRRRPRSPWPTPAPRRSSDCSPARRWMSEGSSRSMRSGLEWRSLVDRSGGVDHGTAGR